MAIKKIGIKAAKMLRIGQGYDLHPLVKGRPLILGGIQITHPQKLGLAGVTDGDCLTHAIIDALLGATGLGDIGQMFPASDPTVKNAASTKLLTIVLQKAWSLGFTIHNIDCTILAEQPKLADSIPQMRQVLCEICQLEENQLSIKATTMEQLGPVGRNEAIAALAVTLLENNSKEAIR